MPLYEYRCRKCSHITVLLCSIKQRRTLAICEQCGGVGKLAVSQISPITDKRFFYTGKYDERLSCHVKGRRHFHNELKKQGLAEISKYDMPKNETMEEKMKKNKTLVTSEMLMKD